MFFETNATERKTAQEKTEIITFIFDLPYVAILCYPYVHLCIPTLLCSTCHFLLQWTPLFILEVRFPVGCLSSMSVVVVGSFVSCRAHEFKLCVFHVGSVQEVPAGWHYKRTAV